LFLTLLPLVPVFMTIPEKNGAGTRSLRGHREFMMIAAKWWRDDVTHCKMNARSAGPTRILDRLHSTGSWIRSVSMSPVTRRRCPHVQTYKKAPRMDDAKLRELKHLLDDFDQKQRLQNREREDRRLALEQFLDGYAAVTESVIKPCFEEFAATLEARGHPCTIEIDKPLDPADSISAGKITLTVFPNAATLSHGNPSLSFKASPNQRKVTASRSTITTSGGIVAGVIGEFELNQITQAGTDQHLLDLAATVFAPPA